MTAFASYTDARCLEHFPTVHLTRFSLTQALTCGVKTVIGTNRASSSTVSGANFECADAHLAEAFAQSRRKVQLPCFQKHCHMFCMALNMVLHRTWLGTSTICDMQQYLKQTAYYPMDGLR